MAGSHPAMTRTLVLEITARAAPRWIFGRPTPCQLLSPHTPATLSRRPCAQETPVEVPIVRRDMRELVTLTDAIS
jgi:hypothetical protein